MNSTLRSSTLLLSLVLLASCGPVQATTGIAHANKQLFEARLAKADVLIPGALYVTGAQYEYQLAMLYLEKSKELEGFAKFEHAAFYAKLAADLGVAAVQHKVEEARRLDRRERIRKGEVLNNTPTTPGTASPK